MILLSNNTILSIKHHLKLKKVRLINLKDFFHKLEKFGHQRINRLTRYYTYTPNLNNRVETAVEWYIIHYFINNILRIKYEI